MKSDKARGLDKGVVGVDKKQSNQGIGDCVHIERHAEVWLHVGHQQGLAKLHIPGLTKSVVDRHLRNVETSAWIVWVFLKLDHHLFHTKGQDHLRVGVDF